MRVPMRLCVACRQSNEKTKLFRVVRTYEDIAVDMTYRMNGRSAYVCKDASCIALAQKKHAFDRSLSKHISEDIYEQLRMMI